MNCGGHVSTSSRATALSSWIDTFIVALLTDRLTLALNKKTIFIMGNSSQQPWAREMTSTSIIESAVSVCNFNYHKIGELATVMTNQFY